MLAQRLMVRGIPENFLVAAVRFEVVHLLGRPYQSRSLAFRPFDAQQRDPPFRRFRAHPAERIFRQKRSPVDSPAPVVAAFRRRPAPLPVMPLGFLHMRRAEPRRRADQCPAALEPAWFLRSYCQLLRCHSEEFATRNLL
jgi:hypothetical protein